MPETHFKILLKGSRGGQNAFAAKRLPYLVPLAVGDEVEDPVWGDSSRKVKYVRFDTEAEYLYLWVGEDQYDDYELLKENYINNGWEVMP